jgi:tetratricopeptide (TPR) repeat protein
LAQIETFSLLRRTETGRYELHELVRQYALAQLRAYPQKEQAAKSRHSAYYLGLLHRYQGSIRCELAARQTVASEEENIRSAWNWASLHAQIETLTQGVTALAEYYENAGYLLEGATTYAHTIERIEDHIAATRRTPAADRLLVLLRIPQAFFLTTQGRLDEADRQLDLALEVAHQLNDTRLLARAYIRRGVVAETRGEPAPVFQRAFESALHYAQAGGWLEYVGQALSHLGWVYRCRLQYDAAQRHYDEALALARANGYADLEATVLGNLGDLNQRAGRFDQAISGYEAALTVIQQFGKLQATGIMLYNLGSLYELIGDWEQSQLYLERAHTLLHGIGYRFCEGLALTALASLHRSQGQPEEGLDYCEEALRIAGPAQYESIQVRALLILGQSLADLGRYDKAVPVYRQALTLARQRHHDSWAFAAQAGLAALALARSDLRAAHRQVEQLLPHLEAIALDAGNKPIAIFLTCLRVLAAAGDPRADEVARRGVQLIETQAASIGNETQRRTFLEQVLENPQFMELAQATVEQQRA